MRYWLWLMVAFVIWDATYGFFDLFVERQVPIAIFMFLCAACMVFLIAIYLGDDERID